MNGLFDNEEKAAPSDDQTSARGGGLALFPSEAESPGSMAERSAQPAPLFPEETADRLVATPSARVEPQTPLVSAPLPMDDAPTVPQRTVTAVPQPQELFEEPEDPLVHKAMRHAQERYPDVFQNRKRVLKARFEALLPLDFDRIGAFGAETMPHVQVVMREVSQSSQNFSALSVSAVIQEITTAARDAAGGSITPHGIAGLLKRVERSVKPFDPESAQNTLMRLYGGVKSIHGRLSSTGDLARETLEAIRTDILVMGVVATMAENTAFSQPAQRRHDLLLTTGQELELAQKQMEALKSQTENALMQIEEVRTVTLPSLGFLAAIHQ